MTHREWIAILDFGAQYTQLIARRIRESRVYCEILPYDTPAAHLRARKPAGIVLSGGPASVYAQGSPHPDPEIFEMGLPVLGICYGLQLMGYYLGGKVAGAETREYGHATIRTEPGAVLFQNLDPALTVWMSHGDELIDPPKGFEVIARSENGLIAAVGHAQRRLYGVQFHPEVVHTPQGRAILNNFLFGVCACTGDWTPQAFIENALQHIRETVGEGRVACFVSGGVDSTVVAALIGRAIGDRLTCIFVDNGLLRKDEALQVQDTYRRTIHARFRFVDASARFLRRLEGVVDPEQKRKIIGDEFIRVLEDELQALPHVEFLAQGTLYPDVIESASVKGPASTIKTHHNVGGLPEDLRLKLLEPVRDLFKDEVRAVGRELGVPEEIITRHPFPGPGLAIRILGEVTPERLHMLREADSLFIQELRATGLYNEVSQALAVLLPVKTVGVMGDERTYESVIALRAVTTEDFMTADWARLPDDLLARVSSRITNQVRGINRVVYDLSTKPPSTIEWE
jgi:GMP synthase (glutamine-hydrolysing)